MQNENNNLDEALWDYTCALYAKNKVEAACLTLQNSFNADVNILLFLCWLVDKNKDISNQKFLQSIIKIAAPWQRDVVEPLRHLRKQIGAMQGLDARKVKASLLRSELEAEKSEQLALLDFLGQTSFSDEKLFSVEQKQNMARLSLMLYFEIILAGEKTKLDKAGKTEVENIISQAFKK
ncbi:MAG: TIGR02444 family protein [Sphingomonadales bacterium]|nr:TIGR02444 family protein [Sphingomonadales bacterium]